MTRFALFAVALALSVSAQAETPINIDAERSVVVRIGDLDLTSARGQSVLRHRLASAIEEVCGSYANVTEPSEIDRVDACRSAALQSADLQLAERSTSLKLAAADDHR